MSSKTKLGILTLIFLTILVALSRLLIKKDSPKASFNFFQNSVNLSKTFSFEFKSNPLGKIVQNDLAGKDGTFGVYVESLKDGEKYGFNENEPFPTASLYKLILLSATFKEIEKGKLTMDTPISSTKSHLTEVFGGVDFGYEDSPENIQYGVGETMDRIGSISDNFAAIMLTEKLKEVSGQDVLIRMAKELGLSQTNLNNDLTTTASDMASYLKLLYQGKIVSPDASNKIIDILSQSKINDRIPANLPDEIRVVHKTGELPNVRHDVGIIYLDNNPYILVLLSKNLKYEDDGVATLAQLSQDIFNYLRQQ